MRIKTTRHRAGPSTIHVTLGKGPLLSPSQGEGGAFSEKLGCELCLASLGGGAAFHEAAADKKLQA